MRQNTNYETAMGTSYLYFVLPMSPLGVVEPTRRNLVMARLTPQVEKGTLTTYLLDETEQTVELDDEIWQRWLNECVECSFHFTSPLGTFAVRRDNSKYWYADGRYNGRNQKVYVGKTEAITISALYRVARKLYARMHREHPPAALLELTLAEETTYRDATARAREAASLPAPSFPAPSQTASHPDSSNESVVYDMALASRLTPREREILLVLSYGLSNPQLVEPLGISITTVKMHLRHIYYKLSLASRNELIAYAKRFKQGEQERLFQIV